MTGGMGGRPTSRHSSGAELAAGAAASDGSHSLKLPGLDPNPAQEAPCTPSRAAGGLSPGGWLAPKSEALSLAPAGRNSKAAAPSLDSGACTRGAPLALARLIRLSNQQHHIQR